VELYLHSPYVCKMWCLVKHQIQLFFFSVILCEMCGELFPEFNGDLDNMLNFAVWPGTAACRQIRWIEIRLHLNLGTKWRQIVTTFLVSSFRVFPLVSSELNALAFCVLSFFLYVHFLPLHSILFFVYSFTASFCFWFTFSVFEHYRHICVLIVGCPMRKPSLFSLLS
jgi:hypothetical protein